jgi:triacylglycerol esterase/lipase EstA (alpha/beta hydrolase family)
MPAAAAYRKNTFIVSSLFLCCFFSVHSVSAACSDPDSPLAALIAASADDPGKIPLILVHGINELPENADVNVDNHEWAEFRKLFASSDIAKSYSLFVLQYCSNRQPVSVIAEKLRDLIDRDLADRDHVIVAHSMGGLVAKSYMAETSHQTGRWKGKRGGDTTLGIITLATPHHGTPGANDSGTMKALVPNKYEAVYGAMETIYWRTKDEKDGLATVAADAANRADLRWDNFDNKLDPSSKDINSALAKTNELFAPFMPKLIAYAGTAESKLNPIQTGMLLLELKTGNSKALQQHNMLTLANVGMVNGLGKNFGEADGMVPIESGLFCRPETRVVNPKPKNYVCTSDARVRRFEAGPETGEVRDLPDKNTLSIVRSERGFDHLDMRDNDVVLNYVITDLAAFLKTARTKPAGK